MSMNYDVAIIGAGIIGTSLAFHHAQAGHKVILLERNPKPRGASIRNFGMIWPIGQAPQTLSQSLKSRNYWISLSGKANFWADPCGSLHLAYHEDEWALLQEFNEYAEDFGYNVTLLSPDKVRRKSKIARTEGLKGALFSSTEVNVDPREAMIQMHRFLTERMQVQIEYNTLITQVDNNVLLQGSRKWQAHHIYHCSGQDLETLFPDLFSDAPITKVKLQMMRTKPNIEHAKSGPMLAAGLTLGHYQSFHACKSLARLKRRFNSEMPEYQKWGIHVMLSRTADQAYTIGDSHEYGKDYSIFDRADLNKAILKYLYGFTDLGDAPIAEYWHGIYTKMTDDSHELIMKPNEFTTIINGLGGAGMTRSLGLTEEIVNAI